MSQPLRLGVNIDHVATVRNARGGRIPTRCAPPMLAIEAGADGITAHLREDRRHIRDDDIAAADARASRKPLNFEMAATDEMLAIALRHRPHAACLVPEKREERTTEGGLDVVGGHDRLTPVVARLQRRRHPRLAVHRAVDRRRSTAAKRDRRAGGRAAHRRLVRRGRAGRTRRGAEHEFERLRGGRARRPRRSGIECHAGHGLDYETAGADRRACRRSSSSTSAIS